MLRRALLLVTVAGVLAAAAPARAQRRDGLAWGVAVGASTLTAGQPTSFGEDPDSFVAVVADFQFGGMLLPRVALLFHLNLARGSDGGAVQHFHAQALIGFRLFVTRVFWAELAAGTSGYSARDTLFGGTIESRAHSFAGFLGMGIEIYQGKTFTFDLRGNIGVADFPGSFEASYLQGLIGLNWY